MVRHGTLYGVKVVFGLGFEAHGTLHGVKVVLGQVYGVA